MTKAFDETGLSRRGLINAGGALAAGVVAPSVLRVRSAYAAYPDRPVKFVVANTPGGPSDIVGRFVTAALEQSTGKTFIVDNRGGAGGKRASGFDNPAARRAECLGEFCHAIS